MQNGVIRLHLETGLLSSAKIQTWKQKVTLANLVVHGGSLCTVSLRVVPIYLLLARNYGYYELDIKKVSGLVTLNLDFTFPRASSSLSFLLFFKIKKNFMLNRSPRFPHAQGVALAARFSRCFFYAHTPQSLTVGYSFSVLPNSANSVCIRARSNGNAIFGYATIISVGKLQRTCCSHSTSWSRVTLPLRGFSLVPFVLRGQGGVRDATNARLTVLTRSLAPGMFISGTLEGKEREYAESYGLKGPTRCENGLTQKPRLPVAN